MKAEKGRAFILCVIALIILIVLGWKHTTMISASSELGRDTQETVREITIVTITPKKDVEDKEQFVNFDLHHLAIVGKDIKDGVKGIGETGEELEPYSEHTGASGAGSEISDTDTSGYEEDPEGTEGLMYTEGNTGDVGTSESVWESESLPELVESESGDEAGLSAWMDEYGNTEDGYSDGYTDESEMETEWIYYGNCRITHYCPCASCCGEYATGYTANGSLATEGRTVATGEDIPFGTEVMIGDQVYIAEDRGVGYGEIDVFVNDHQTALNMGQYYTDVYIRYPEE